MSTTTKYIHIHAKCDYFEIFEQVTDKQSLSRLNNIKRMFLAESKRQGKGVKNVNGKTLFLVDQVGLKVKTRIINPTLL